MADVPRRKFVAYVVGALLLGGAVGAVVAGVLDSDSSSTSTIGTNRTTTTRAATTTTIPATTTTAAVIPPCTSDAILSAVQNSGINATSVSGIQCGNGWAGASYETPQATGAALLRAQGNHWAGANRAQDCNDPSIPPAVHFYCTVS